MLAELVQQLYAMQKANEKFRRENPGKPGKEVRVDYLDAVFYDSKRKSAKEIGRLGVLQAMDCLVNGVIFFGDFTLSDVAKVRVVQV